MDSFNLIRYYSQSVEGKRVMEFKSVEDVETRLTREVALILSLEQEAIRTDVPLPSLGLDSMGFVELLVVIEKVFALRLIETGLTRNDFETIHALAARIHKVLPE